MLKLLQNLWNKLFLRQKINLQSIAQQIPSVSGSEVSTNMATPMRPVREVPSSMPQQQSTSSVKFGNTSISVATLDNCRRDLFNKLVKRDLDNRPRDYNGTHASVRLGFPDEADRGMMAGSCWYQGCQSPGAIWKDSFTGLWACTKCMKNVEVYLAEQGRSPQFIWSEQAAIQWAMEQKRLTPKMK